MPSSQDQNKLEKLIDQVLKTNDYQYLHAFLQEDIDEGTTFKCSKQFFTKLDKLVNKALDEKKTKNASLALSILSKCGNNLSLPGGQGLSFMVAQNLVKKWFEKCRELWIQGPKRDGMLLNVAEDFFDSLMVVHEASKEGTYEITQFLLYHIGQLVADPRIYVLIQKEAIRKLNIIVGRIPEELKNEKKILSSQEASDMMVKLAGHVLDCGDYDLQIALMEALIRMTSPGQRMELAGQWFAMEYVASAFINIKDSEFETDCRKFLNLVNVMQGDNRRVYSYPCLRVFLNKNELLIPSDEKLEEFWIDFNLSSQSISFYFSAHMEVEGEWDTMCITENEVESYTIADQGRSSVLKLKLLEPVCTGVFEGTSLTIHFNSSLGILQAACSVYGSLKNKSVVGKKSSVVKTSVKIIMDDSCSQTVPESQAYAGGDKETERNSTASWLQPTARPVKTAGNKKVSESTTFITSSSRGSVSSVSPFSAIGNPPIKWKVKGPLQMVRSSEKQDQLNPGVQGVKVKTSGHAMTPISTISERVRQQSETSLHSKVSKPTPIKKHIPMPEVVKAVLAEQEEEQGPLDQSFVPDSQPNMKLDRSLLPNWRKNSVSEMLMMQSTLQTQRTSFLQGFEPRPSLKQQEQHPSSDQKTSIPESGPLSHKRLHKELTQRLQKIIQSTEPQELAKSKRTTPQTRETSLSKDSTDECGSTRCAPKKPQQQQGEKRHLTKEHTHTRTKAAVKPTSTKVLQDLTNVKDSGTISSKEKRAAEVADNMVKEIYSRYDKTNSSTVAVTPHWAPKPVKRSMLDSWLPTVNKQTPSAVLMKSFSNTQRPDVFAFGSDTVVPGTKLAESFARESSGSQDLLSRPTTTKKERVLKGKQWHAKKHLFSDTESDVVTEVSWVKDSCRKPKPKVRDYSRQLPSWETKVPDTAYKSPDFPLQSPKPVTKKYNQNETPWMKGTAGHRMEEQALSHRPQRAAATIRKSYRELDTDESQSDSEQEGDETNKKADKKKELDELIEPVVAAQKVKKCVGEKTYEEAAAAKMRKSIAGSNKPTKTYQGGQAESEPPATETNRRKNTSSNKPTKTYWEQDQDGQAESEPPATETNRRKNTSSNKPTKTYWEQDGQAESEQTPGPKETSDKTWREAAEVKRNKSAPSKQFSTTYRESFTDSRSEQTPITHKYVMEKEKMMSEEAEAKRTNSSATKKPTKSYRASDHDSQSESKQLPGPKKCVMEKEKMMSEEAEAKRTNSAATKKITKSYGASDHDSQSESKQLPGPKKCVMEKSKRMGEEAEAKMTNNAATKKPTKGYRESGHDSQSESEQLPCPKKCVMEKSKKLGEEAEAKRRNGAATKKPTKGYWESDHDSQSDSEQLPCPKKCVMEKSKKMGEEAEAKRTTSAATKKHTKSYRESDHDSQSESDSKQLPCPKKCVMEKSKRMGEEAEAKRRNSAATKKPTKGYWESDHDSQSESEQLPCPKPTVWPVATVNNATPPTRGQIQPVRIRAVAAPNKHAITQRKTETSHKTSELKKKKIPSIREPTEEEMNDKLTSYTWNDYKKMRSPEWLTPTRDLSLPSLLGSPLPAIQARSPMRLYVPELSPIQPALYPAPMSPFSQGSQPPMASTALDLEELVIMPSPPSSQVELSPHSQSLQSGLGFNLPLSPDYGSGMESVSQVVSLSHESSFSSNKTSVPISRLEITSVTAATTLPKNMEKTPFSDEEKSTYQQQYHMSGPNRKRQTAARVSSSSEEEEKEEGRKVKNQRQRSATIKPRKLFKTNIDEFPEGEVSQEESHMVSSRRWETHLEDDDIDTDAEMPDIDPSDMGSICRQFSSELKKKYQNRSSRLQSYTKQSMKIAHQHMSSFTMQTSEYRTRRLQNVQHVLIEETNNLEQDDIALKNMEKEFTTFWKKQSTALHTYQESGTQRLMALKTTLQSNVCHSVQYEEKTLTTQMCLMRKDMKSVQDKLLKDMHEEELRNVKRGLQALFLPGGAMF